ncbi:PilZ domain-containing protein [Methylobacterium durans]|uniref:PilZ domain-containing protein n=1 Tax=Methylobacterium durans TaxID=2202825 RepID=A0A2U8W7S5_9HYPH|nr:PilZ domain-containing protein [Methylobacterium durans]AWN41432.1 PilZ domain-containing protein [Methylobacterium durans]
MACPGIDRRRTERQEVDLPGSVGLANGRRLACAVTDLSGAGARLAFAEIGLLPVRFALRLGALAARPVRLVWRRGPEIGIAFEAEGAPEVGAPSPPGSV